MKNFPSTLIKQKTTKQGLGDKLSTTITNIGSGILKNIFSSGNTGSELSIDTINQKFNEGYETLDLEHEIDKININKYHKPLFNQINNGDIDNIIYNRVETLTLNNFKHNGYNVFKNDVSFEDPFLLSSSVFSVINNYKYILSSTVPNVLEHPKPISDKENTDFEMATVHDFVSPSLFNPFTGVSVIGMTEHIPLVITGNDDLKKKQSLTLDNGFGSDTPPEKDANGEKKETSTITLEFNTMLNSSVDVSDCSIRTLVNESKIGSEGNLGLATYRYIDFMFCKDLGKISNNHLITLRKFPGPIGDNIFKEAYPKAWSEYVDGGTSIDGKQKYRKASYDNLNQGYFDIGRLVTWFGTEDNKLEDICKFNYNATWKEFHSEIQQINSEQQDQGWLDKMANTFSLGNNRLVSKGFSSNTGLLGWAASKINIPIIGNNNMSNATYGWNLLSNYDQHKIYEPADTIWDTHKYEGKLTFNQEITLTFRYVLRSYSNINPKSAFLDLLANILTVTYRRGSFWGGETKIIGPQGNNSVYRTANAWIDKTFNALGGIWTSIQKGSFSLSELQGWLSNAVGKAAEIVDKTKDNAGTMLGMNGEGPKKQKQQEVKQKAQEKTQEGMKKAAELNKKYGWTDALKGMIKNQLGRPAMYAANSILSGEPVGPWHLTIGNPKNPIMSMGNMIMTGAEIQHSGPLGIDDFPTEIKLTVTLKHGRPRDSVEIQKMYTKGRSSIYKPMNMMQLNKFKTNSEAFGDIEEISNITGEYYEDIYEEPINKKESKKGKGKTTNTDSNNKGGAQKVTNKKKKEEYKSPEQHQQKLSDRVLAKTLRSV